MKITKSDKSTAYHEAGHTVMAWYCAFKVMDVSINPKGNTLGHMNAQPCERHPFGLTFWSDASSEIVIEIQDNQDRRLTEGERRYIELIDPLEIEQKHILYSASGEIAQKKYEPDTFLPDHSLSDWESVYEDLYYLASQKGVDVSEIRNELYKLAQDILHDEHIWKGVEALANALINKQDITGDEAIRIIEEALVHL